MLSNVPTLSDEDRIPLQGPIELNKIESVIDALPSNKTPGPDGVCAEFYKQFKSILSRFLLILFTQANKVKNPAASYGKHTLLYHKANILINLDMSLDTGQLHYAMSNIKYLPNFLPIAFKL